MADYVSFPNTYVFSSVNNFNLPKYTPLRYSKFIQDTVLILHWFFETSGTVIKQIVVFKKCVFHEKRFEKAAHQTYLRYSHVSNCLLITFSRIFRKSFNLETNFVHQGIASAIFFIYKALTQKNLT